MAKKKNITKEQILRKVNRKRNPVGSMAELAREFGYNTNIYRWDTDTSTSTAAPGSFRNKVRSLVGERMYNKIRDNKSVNLSYR